MDPKLQKSAVLDHIRKAVKNRLIQSPVYLSLGPDKRRQIAHDTVNALTYIVGGESGDNTPSAVTLSGNSRAFGPAAPKPSSNAPMKPLAPSGEKPPIGGAAREGGQAFTDVIADVNFPAFVGGLIDGVFNSIVTTSIKQMEAYAEMVKNVSKSVDQYMKDNVSENNARDYLAERYPDHLEIDLSGEKPKLKPKEGYDESNLPDFFSDLGLKAPVTSLDEDNVEQELVPAGRRRIAMDRQQLLATMVMMGVNRLVVTNGTIEASCFFELDTSDIRKNNLSTTAEAEMNRQRGGESGYDGSYSRQNKWDGKWKQGGGWFDSGERSGTYSGQVDQKTSWYGKSSWNDTAKFKITTVSTKADEQTINMHAQLGGKVKVNFKSDYFPMEKMIDALQVNMIRDKTNAGIVPKPPPAPASPPVALPPPPPLPGIPTPGPVPAPAAPQR
jgi:hypothetical protein